MSVSGTEPGIYAGAALDDSEANFSTIKQLCETDIAALGKHLVRADKVADVRYLAVVDVIDFDQGMWIAHGYRPEPEPAPG